MMENIKTVDDMADFIDKLTCGRSLSDDEIEKMVDDIINNTNSYVIHHENRTVGSFDKMTTYLLALNDCGHTQKVLSEILMEEDRRDVSYKVVENG